MHRQLLFMQCRRWSTTRTSLSAAALENLFYRTMTSEQFESMPYDTFCVVVSKSSGKDTNDDVTALGGFIHPDEAVFANERGSQSKFRLSNFIGGRIALRKAITLATGSADMFPILPNEWGAPSLPNGLIGSISHKDDIMVGVASTGDGQLGVDIERCTNKAAQALSRRILTGRERERLGRIPSISAEEEILLLFSLKESVFKALHPLLKRHIEFLEVEIEPLPDNTAKLTFLLRTGEHYAFKAMWKRFQTNYWLTCVKLKQQ